MKKKMSVGELKRYYENRRPKQILFCTANQAWHKVDDPMKIAMSFTSMAMACNPNVICLKSGENMVWFERVKNITVDSDRTPLGTVLDIVCGDSVDRGNDIHYTVITS